MGTATVRTRGSNDGDGERYDVLVVDDDEALAAVVAESLEYADSDLRTSYTTDAREALTRIRQDQLDCLVTDYEMPRIDGLGLVDRDESDTPFVVFTQHRDDQLARATADRGGAYLRKGVGSEQYQQLAALVREQAADE